jgi:hypothetical protein
MPVASGFKNVVLSRRGSGVTGASATGASVPPPKVYTKTGFGIIGRPRVFKWITGAAVTGAFGSGARVGGTTGPGVSTVPIGRVGGPVPPANATVLQSKSTSGKSTTLDIVWTNNCTVGSTLVAVCYWDNTSATCSVAEPNNGTWVPIGSPQNGAGALAGYRLQMFAAFGNVTPAKPLVIGTISAPFTDGGICLIELSAGGTAIENVVYGTSAAANPSHR